MAVPTKRAPRRRSFSEAQHEHRLRSEKHYEQKINKKNRGGRVHGGGSSGNPGRGARARPWRSRRDRFPKIKTGNSSKDNRGSDRESRPAVKATKTNRLRPAACAVAADGTWRHRKAAHVDRQEHSYITNGQPITVAVLPRRARRRRPAALALRSDWSRQGAPRPTNEISAAAQVEVFNYVAATGAA